MIINKLITRITSTGRNSEGRTPFVEHRIVNGKFKISHGEFLDSPSDLEKIEKLNQEMEKVKRISILKQHKSFQDSKKIILTL